MAQGLYDACMVGNVDLVRRILHSGRDTHLNTFTDGPLQHFALHTVCLSGNGDIVDLLCRFGADPNVRDVVGETPLHAATRKHFRRVMELLVGHGADVDAPNTLGDTPLHVAVSSNVQPYPATPESAVHCYQAYHTLCTLLHLAPTLKPNEQGWTALDLACYYRNENIIDKLLEKTDFGSVEGNVRTLRWLLHEEYFFMSTAVRLLRHTSAVSDRFRLLIQVLVDSRDKYDINFVTLPNIKAVLYGPSSVLVPGGIDALLFAAIDYQSAELVKLIISHEASVNSQHYDTFPLQLACLGQSLDIVKILILHGALVNACDEVTVNKVTPLHLATTTGHTECMQLLLQNGAQVNVKETGTGRTPLHIAYINRRSDQVNLLLSCGADTAIRDNLGRTPLELQFPG